ncbi:MAG TPA: hypothetical protein VK504_28535, partial [Vicinamibacterales bacterium]|nr:hypothetical protein [Vicinamibacterales bacterium]
MSRGSSCTTAVARRSRILFASFGFSIAAAVTLAIVLMFTGATAEASTCALSNTSAPVNWSNPAKWTSCAGTYPNNGDTAQIGLTGGYTLVVDVPVNVVLQVQTSSFTALDVSNTLQLEASSTSVSGANLTINSGGKLTTAPSAVITNVLANITVNNGGTLEVQSGGQFSIGSFTTFIFAGGQLKGPGTLNNPVSTPIVFTGASGPMSMTGALIFNNSGIVNLVSSTNPLSIDSGTQFNNQSGATFNITTSVPIATDGFGARAINNDNSIVATAGTNPTINVPVNNNGTITLGATGGTQTLTLAGGGTHTGVFNLTGPPIGIVAFNGPHNFNSGWSWNTGANNSVFKLHGGTSTFNAGFATPFF